MQCDRQAAAVPVILGDWTFLYRPRSKFDEEIQLLDLGYRCCDLEYKRESPRGRVAAS